MKSRTMAIFLRTVLFVSFCVSLLAFPVNTTKASAKKASAFDSLSNLPLLFIQNNGQMDPNVKFYVKTPGQTLFFTENGIVFDLLRKQHAPEMHARADHRSQNPAKKMDRLVFNLVFENAREDACIEGIGSEIGKIHYLKGSDRDQWKADIPAFRGIVYKEIYDGTDLRIFGNGRDIEYEFVVHQGANPRDIRLSYEGIEGISIDDRSGQLLISTAFGELRDSRPYIYQEMEENRKPVDGKFLIHAMTSQTETGKFSYGFSIGSYDAHYPLVIDPTLSYSTYIGGNGEDYGLALTVDTSSNVYITGTTSSTNFPTQNPYKGGISGEWDAFVTKLSNSGATLVYSTYLGGSDYDEGRGLAVDASGSAYVTGNTYSTDFPVASAYQQNSGGYFDAFLTKLSPSGTLSFSTYLGGNWSDYGFSIAVDVSGNAYITGETQSTDFPVRNAYQSQNAGGKDAFVTKFLANGALYYSTYLGGAGDDSGYRIAVDGSGNAYIAGETASANFKVQNAYQSQNAGGKDAFITKLSAAGSSLSYSTYLGGISDDSAFGIAVDTSGNAYVTGKTASTNFPVQNPYQAAKAGAIDAFISKLPASGGTLTYSTFLGGSADDKGQAITVGTTGEAYITGETASTNFPVTNAYQTSNAGNTDAFLAKLGPSGTSLSESTYLGGASNDHGYGIAIDSSENIYIAGDTGSSDFPTQTPYQSVYAGQLDAFITKFQGQNSVIYINKEDATCNGHVPCYTSIQSALNAASTGATLKIAQGEYTESIALNTSKTIILEGGYDNNFTPQGSGTNLTNAPTVTDGSLTLRSLSIKP